MMDSMWVRILLAVLLYSVFTLLQLLSRRTKFVRQAGIPFNILFLLLSVYILLDDFLTETLSKSVQAGALYMLAYIGIRLFDTWFFGVIIQRRLKRPLPVVVRDISRWVVLAITFFLILKIIFPDLPLNILAFSSIVVGYIVGNATQDTLGNLIAGLALNTESPFSIGDWVMVGGHTGRVAEMTWRATRLRTKNNDHIVIPNSTIAREPIVNYSRPTMKHGFTLELGVSYEVPPNTIRRVLLEVLDNVPAVLKDPPPRVWLTKYNDFSIDYTIKFYISDFERLEEIESQVMYLVWYHFKREQITIPFPIRDVRMAPSAPTAAMGDDELINNEQLAILRGIDLFNPLSDTELSLVSRELREEIYADDETIIRQGDEGNTIYIVTSGTVRVEISTRTGENKVTTLGIGDYFGEASLLTGEKRNATVTAAGDTSLIVLSHNMLGRLIQSNSKLADDLARELKKRQEQYTETLQAESIDIPELETKPESHSALVARIKSFLGLND